MYNLWVRSDQFDDGGTVQLLWSECRLLCSLYLVPVVGG